MLCFRFGWMSFYTFFSVLSLIYSIFISGHPYKGHRTALMLPLSLNKGYITKYKDCLCDLTQKNSILVDKCWIIATAVSCLSQHLLLQLAGLDLILAALVLGNAPHFTRLCFPKINMCVWVVVAQNCTYNHTHPSTHVHTADKRWPQTHLPPNTQHSPTVTHCLRDKRQVTLGYMC